MEGPSAMTAPTRWYQWVAMLRHDVVNNSVEKLEVGDALEVRRGAGARAGRTAIGS